MRRTKNISKRIATAILAAALTMTSASATVLLNPTVAYAETLPDNNDTSGTVDVSAGDSMVNNYGIIDEVENAAQGEDGSSGYVLNNYGTITTNNGEVSNNRTYDYSRKGKIVTNNGIVAVNDTGLTNNGEDDGNGIRTNNGTVNTNYGYIDDNQGAVHTNRGYINKNAGNDPTTTIYDSYISKGVHENNGTINDNTGLVEINYSSGTITNNSGTVTTNKGTVNSTSGDGAGIIINKGTANDVKSGGIVVLNTGTVELTGGGTVTDNFGSVSSSGSDNAVENQYAGSITGVVSVTNYYGGNLNGDVSVINNFSDQDITATNQYRSVSFVASEHSSASYGNDFTERTPMNSDGTTGVTKYYVNVTEGQNGTGTITIVADSNYTLEGADVDNGQLEGYAFTYSLKKQTNGSYKLTINAWNGNSLELSQGMFNLVVKAIEQANDPVNPPSPSPSPNPSPSPEPSTEPDSNTALLTGFVNPFGTIGLYNTTDQTAMKEVAAYEAAIIAEINALPASGGVVSVPNLAQTGLSASVVEALFAKNDAPITLTYTVDGITYMLVIPAGFNLLTLLNAYGGIDFAKLIAVFGASIVVG